jgi:hypothetical protein
MTFTASDVGSLTRSLSRWEFAEYVFAGLVTLACAGEYIANFTDWLTGGIEDKKKRLEKGSTLLLVAALTFELVCLVKTNQISGRVIGSLDEKAKEASTKSEEAINKSASALSKAGQAEQSADTASNGASQAHVIARGARQEADKAVEEAENARREQEAITAENVRLQQQINPRRLSESQKRDLIAKLSAAPPFFVRFNEFPAPNDTSEVFDFKDDLKDVFSRMKLLLPEPPTTGHVTILRPTRVRGVIIGIKSKAESPAAAVVLCKALTDMGFKASLAPLSDPLLAPITYPLPDANTMFIKVGPKQ